MALLRDLLLHLFLGLDAYLLGFARIEHVLLHQPVEQDVQLSGAGAATRNSRVSKVFLNFMTKV